MDYQPVASAGGSPNPGGGGGKKDGGKKGDSPMTNKDYDKIAKDKGMKETNEFGKPHGEKVYKGTNGKYYSPDNTQHNGGVWKVFEKRGGQLERVGTADKYLKIFKK